MSWRNPFITSYLYDTSEAERIAAVLRVACIDVVVHMNRTGLPYAISGLHTASWPGALDGEDLEHLTDMLIEAGVTGVFSIAFAGEQPEDRLVFTYDPSNWHPASHR